MHQREAGGTQSHPPARNHTGISHPPIKATMTAVSPPTLDMITTTYSSSWHTTPAHLRSQIDASSLPSTFSAANSSTGQQMSIPCDISAHETFGTTTYNTGSVSDQLPVAKSSQPVAEEGAAEFFTHVDCLMRAIQTRTPTVRASALHPLSSGSNGSRSVKKPQSHMYASAHRRKSHLLVRTSIVATLLGY